MKLNIQALTFLLLSHFALKTRRVPKPIKFIHPKRHVVGQTYGNPKIKENSTQHTFRVT